MDFLPLDDATRRRFDEDGYLIVRNALSKPQVDDLVAASDRLFASDRVADRTAPGDAYDGFRNVVGFGGAPFERLLTNAAAVPLAMQLLSRNVQLHTSQLIYKKPEKPGADPKNMSPGWHRDIHTVPSDLGEADNRRFEVKIAYYFSEARTRQSGVTLVARGSHRWTSRPAFDSHGDPPDVVVPELGPGDALLFENRTWHAATVNTSEVVRKCAIFGYSFRWMRPDDWVEQEPELLRRLDPVGRDLLTPMRWRDDEGRFSLKPNNQALHDWFDQHNARGAADALKADAEKMTHAGAMMGAAK